MEEEDFKDMDLDEYERRIMEMSDEDEMGGPKKKPAQKKKPVQQAAKGGDQEDNAEEDPDILDLERQLAALDEDHEEVLTKSAPKIVEEHVVSDGEDPSSGNKDKNGVDEDVLIEEEDKYHEKEQIRSFSALKHDIETHIDPILNGMLVGEDYRDILSANKDSWEMYIDRIIGFLQSGKLDLAKYLDMANAGLRTQLEILGKAQKQKASKTTMLRIAGRVKVIEAEIKEIKEQMGGGGGGGEEPAPQDKTGPAQGTVRHAEEGSMEETRPRKKSFQVPKEKLERLSSVLNQYIYLVQYWVDNKMEPDREILMKVKEVKQLFKDPYSITAVQYKEAMEELKPITLETLIGMSISERQAKVDHLLEEAEKSFDKMKELGCSKEEAMETANTIKYLRKIKEAAIVPIPQIRVANLEKEAKSKLNNQVPENTVSCTFLKLSGAAGHRVFFLKYSFNPGKGVIEGDIPYVNWYYPAQR